MALRTQDTYILLFQNRNARYAIALFRAFISFFAAVLFDFLYFALLISFSALKITEL